MQRSVRGGTPGRSLSLDVVPAGDLKRLVNATL